jgi:8-oxo-dGTP pyrophosphatase MutT (NUDIX family)
MGRHRDRTLTLLHAATDALRRSHYEPGHITASALVLPPDRGHVLLVFHERLRRWLQPGGHVEPGDPDVVNTAEREAIEEAGVRMDSRTAPELIAVDVHEIPAARGEPFHLHHDLMFRFLAADRSLSAAREKAAVVWCPTNRLAEFGVDGALRRGVSRAMARDHRLGA